MGMGGGAAAGGGGAGTTNPVWHALHVIFLPTSSGGTLNAFPHFGQLNGIGSAGIASSLNNGTRPALATDLIAYFATVNQRGVFRISANFGETCGVAAAAVSPRRMKQQARRLRPKLGGEPVFLPFFWVFSGWV